MIRYTTSLVLLALAAVPARAHFIWIVPERAVDGQATARMVLSEDLQPDDPKLLDKIAQTELFVRGANGKTAPVEMVRDKDAFRITVPGTGPSVLGGICRYGLFQRGNAEPFLLMYYPKAFLAAAPHGPSRFREACDRLPLEIVSGQDAGTFRVLWQGQPLPGAEIVVLSPGKDKSEEKKADERGVFALDLTARGLYGLRVRRIEARAGELDGKKYQAVRHYATLVFEVPEARPEKAAALAPLPQAVSSFGAAVADGWLYLYGGHTGKTHQYSTETVSGSFRRLKLSNPTVWEELPGGPSLQGLALVAHGGKVYRIGGMQPRNRPGEPADNHSLATCVCYDPAKKVWEPLPDMPDGRSSHDAVVVGDKLIVVGGWRSNGAGRGPNWYSTALVLDLSRQPLRWESVEQPFRRRALTAAVHDGNVYVIGGLTEDARSVLTVNIFDPATNAWSTGPDIPGPQSNGFAPASCAAGGRLFVNPADGKLYRLDARGAAWEVVGSLQQPRSVHRMVANGELLIAVGGAGGGGNVARTEAVALSGGKSP